MSIRTDYINAYISTRNVTATLPLVNALNAQYENLTTRQPDITRPEIISHAERLAEADAKKQVVYTW